MVVKMVENERNESQDTWTCNNCGFSFSGFDEDRPSGKMGRLCPECFDNLPNEEEE